MLTETYIEVRLVDEELADFLESAFLSEIIDGVTQELATLWLEVNHPCEQ